MLKIIFLLVFLLSSGKVYGQDLDNWILEYSKEKPLKEVARGKDEAYRLFIQPMGYISQVISIKNKDGQYELIFKRGQSSGPNPQFVEKKIKISKADWDGFKKLADEMDFWSSPKLKGCRIGFDGTTFYLEGFSGNKYQHVQCWSPEKGEFLKVIDYLKKLSESVSKQM